MDGEAGPGQGIESSAASFGPAAPGDPSDHARRPGLVASGSTLQHQAPADPSDHDLAAAADRLDPSRIRRAAYCPRPIRSSALPDTALQAHAAGPASADSCLPAPGLAALTAAAAQLNHSGSPAQTDRADGRGGGSLRRVERGLAGGAETAASASGTAGAAAAGGKAGGGSGAGRPNNADQWNSFVSRHAGACGRDARKVQPGDASESVGALQRGEAALRKAALRLARRGVGPMQRRAALQVSGCAASSPTQRRLAAMGYF